MFSTSTYQIYQQAEKVGKMDSNLITYLRESDRRYNETRQTKQIYPACPVKLVWYLISTG